MESHKWTINKRVLQYSSIVALNRTNKVRYEAVLLLERNITNIRDFRCVFALREKIIFSIAVESMTFLESHKHSIYLARCSTSYRGLYSKKYTLAVVDISEFERSGELIMTQRPSVIDASIPKAKSIINCVHQVRNVDELRGKKIRNWIAINREIGQSGIIFYSAEQSQLLKQIERENKGYVRVIDYQSNVKEICESNFLNLPKCMRTYGKFFSQEVFNLHEKISTNDCLTHVKYTHELMTNYDIDELILPRHLKPSVPDCSRFEDCHREYEGYLKSQRYDLYSYAQFIFELSHHQASYIEFLNYQVLNDPDLFYAQLDQTLSLNKPILTYTQGEADIDFKVELQRDRELLKRINSTRSYVKWLNKTYFESHMEKLDHKWTRPVASRFTFYGRRGKSIFRTDLVTSIHQHHAVVMQPGTEGYLVPATLGFTSHFRDTELYTFVKRTQAIGQNVAVHIDLEYLLFLAKISNKL